MTAAEQAEALAQRIGARKVGKEWRAHCPVHDDENPSLDFRAEGDKLLFVCRAGCDSVDILAEFRYLYPGIMEGHQNVRQSAQVASWTIRDAYGVPVAIHERYARPGGKQMPWKRPPGKEHLGPVKPAELPLYRLPELMEELRQYEGEPECPLVVVTEGEKDADAAVRWLGFCAVGTVTGASSIPCDDSLRPLVGCRVLLWPDWDDIGKQHMARIQARLEDLGQTDIKWIWWEDAPPKGGAADFKGTKDDVLRLAVDTPPHAKPSGPDNPHRITVADVKSRGKLIDVMDYYKTHHRMPDSISTGMHRLDGMLLGGWRPEMFYILGGLSGYGKTALFLQWAMTAAPLLAPKTVGLISPEMSRESLDIRVLSYATRQPIHDYNGFTWENAEVPQNIRASFDPKDMDSFVAEENPALLIVDYAQQAVPYASDRRYTELAELGAWCLEVAKSRKIPVLLGTQVNFDSKTGTYTTRESQILRHQADAMIFIDIRYGKEPDMSGNLPILSSQFLLDKHRHGPTGRIAVTWDKPTFRFEEDYDVR